MKNAILKKDHPLSYSCFSKCTDWKLNSTIVANKETYGIVKRYLTTDYQCQGLFFQKTWDEHAQLPPHKR
jgi:hypothetical protein